MEYICPYCHQEFEESYWACDNECATIYCLKCDGEVYVYKGELIQGHDPFCGEFEDI